MRSTSCFLLIFILILALFTGCSCKHEWEELNCTSPQKCRLCGKTDGTVLGHNYRDLDCITDGVCTRCGNIQEAAGHDWMREDHNNKIICSVCDFEIVLPEITHSMREKLPALRAEIIEVMGDAFTEEFEQDIDTFMATLQHVYNSFLNDRDIRLFSEMALLAKNKYESLFKFYTLYEIDIVTEWLFSTESLDCTLAWSTVVLNCFHDIEDIAEAEKDLIAAINACAQFFYQRDIIVSDNH